MKSPITTHVLDTANGYPAEGIEVVLEKKSDSGRWEELARGKTNSDGRITDWLSVDKPAETGVYRVTFLVEAYLKSQNAKEIFYSEIPVIFHLNTPTLHYHIPLLLNPFGYSTYRGS
jgi:5-hydroxyisourate hydrolase